jgi:hypothetical protein
MQSVHSLSSYLVPFHGPCRPCSMPVKSHAVESHAVRSHAVQSKWISAVAVVPCSAISYRATSVQCSWCNPMWCNPMWCNPMRCRPRTVDVVQSVHAVQSQLVPCGSVLSVPCSRCTPMWSHVVMFHGPCRPSTMPCSPMQCDLVPCRPVPLRFSRGNSVGAAGAAPCRPCPVWGGWSPQSHAAQRCNGMWWGPRTVNVDAVTSGAVRCVPNVSVVSCSGMSCPRRPISFHVVQSPSGAVPCGEVPCRAVSAVGSVQSRVVPCSAVSGTVSTLFHAV